MYAFTLIELLVVIAVLSLLLTIFVPSMLSARDQAKSGVCQILLREVARAGMAYSGANNTYIVPLGYKGGGDWWTGILVFDGYLRAPKSADPEAIAEGPSTYRCPAGTLGVDNTWTWEPTTAPFEPRNMYGYAGRSTRGNEDYYVHSWYAANGTTWWKGWPMTRVPPDGSSELKIKYKTSHDLSPERTMMAYDGRVIHNAWYTAPQDNDYGYTIVRMTSARHLNQRKMNAGFFDGHAEAVPVEWIPSPYDTNPSRPARFRFETW